MKFSSEAQLSACCRVLLGRVGIAHLWQVTGPTGAAVDVLLGAGYLSGDGHVLLKICFDLWNGRHSRIEDDAAKASNPETTRAVWLLLHAGKSGPSGIDSWVEEQLATVARRGDGRGRGRGTRISRGAPLPQASRASAKWGTGLLERLASALRRMD